MTPKGSIPGTRASEAVGRPKMTAAIHAPAAAEERFLRVGTLADLEARGRMVVKGRRCPLLVVYHDGQVRASIPILRQQPYLLDPALGAGLLVVQNGNKLSAYDLGLSPARSGWITSGGNMGRTGSPR